MEKNFFGLCIILAFGLVACQKTDVSTSTTAGTSSLKSAEISVSDIHIESIASESQYEADLLSNAEDILRSIASEHGKFSKYLDLKGGLRYQIGHCPDVVIDTAEAGYPISITLNYGDSTVTHNGNVLSGKIGIVISGPKETDGTTRTITYTDFSVDSVIINGTISELFSGDNVSTRKLSETDDLVFNYPDTTSYERIGERVHNWLEGIDTDLDPDDDKIEITGNIKVTSSTGDSYLKTIVEPLIRLGSCKYYVQGITQITLNSEIISETNYGDGECDNEAILTVSGVDSTITLNSGIPKHKHSGHNGKGH